ncbi:MAG: HD domain-containing protein [Gemmatimonadaceae bacterium]|nr:HD domain-containing protein [Gemmatimonadaceae bacterium]
MGPRFTEALVLASEAHATQRRKGTDIPYIGHLLAVAALVIEAGGDEDAAIAALLHDAVEDQGGAPMLQQIRERFGPDVADIVDACTDTDVQPKPEWRARKEAYIAAIAHKSAQALLVSLADKVHNAAAILLDHQQIGDAVWTRFNGGRAGTLWYYRALADAFRGRTPLPLWERLDATVHQLEVRCEASGASAALARAATADAEWAAFTDALALCLGAMNEDEFLVISHKRASYYVQFAAEGSYGMRAEAACNTFIAPEDSLIDTQYSKMADLGWLRATVIPSDTGTDGDPDGSPNFFRDIAAPVNHAALSQLAVTTFRTVYGVGHPGALQYFAFALDGASIRFPTLRLKHHLK